MSKPRAAAPAGTRTRAPRRRRQASIKLATGPFRLWSAFCVVAFVISIFAARLVQLQGIDENDYAALALEKNATTVTLEAPRASIMDRNGVALAQSVDSAKLVADPTYTKLHAREMATYLHHTLKLDYIEALSALRKPDTRYVVVARHLDPERAAAVVTHFEDAKWPGVYVDKDTTRVYAANDVAANLVGFVGADNTGLYGLEESLNSTLAGTDGSATFQMANGQQLPLADETVVQPQEGVGVQLTIDEDLQYQAQLRIAQAVQQSGGRSGSAVVMDVKTGQILAQADYPTFNPNSYEDSPRSDYSSRALDDAYEPGSVEKILTFASLIDAGYVTPRTKISVPATLPRDGSVIHDYFGHGTLHLTAAGVIAKSSNIGTVLATSKMPADQLYGYLQSFGLGKPTGVGYNGESSGVLPPLADWLPLTKDTVAFGQGLSVNAVQMAAAVSAVANHGVYVQPSLVDSYVSADGDVTPAPAPETHRVVSAKAARDVARMMELVVGPDGTAPDAAIKGYDVAGKTGTAQRVNVHCHCYRGFTVSFAGFAPAADPRFAVYVVVQHPTDGNGGGITAGPVFHDLMAATLQKFGVPPAGRHEPALPVYW